LLLGLVSALRSGSIQVRLAFIVVTLVLLLVFEAISSPTAVNSPASHKSVDTAATEVKP
jgi:hypothetical protein